MNNQTTYGKWQLISIVQLLNRKQDLKGYEKVWAKLNLPHRLLPLKTGVLLPVNHRTMPLGYNESGRLLVDLDSFHVQAIKQNEVNLEALDDLKLYTNSYPWDDVECFRDYKYRLNELLGYPGPGLNEFG